MTTKRIALLLAVLAVGVGAALTYYVFEAAVHLAIDFVWEDVFNTNQYRLLIVPICLVFSLLYFYVKHFLSPTSDHHEDDENTARPTQR